MMIFKKILIGLVISLASILVIALIYLRTNTYEAVYEDLSFLEMSQTDGNIRIFEPLAEPLANIIFYPGGLVQRDSYAYLAYLLANEGFRVFLVGMPLHLAILNSDAANDIKQAYPSDLKWYIGGHSLGGASASIFVSDHATDFDGLFFLGAYPANSADLSNKDISVLSITASNDLILDQENFQKTKTLLPDDTIYASINGGNHSYFGFYGDQKNDGIATISRIEQHTQTVLLLTDWIKS